MLKNILIICTLIPVAAIAPLQTAFANDPDTITIADPLTLNIPAPSAQRDLPNLTAAEHKLVDLLNANQYPAAKKMLEVSSSTTHSAPEKLELSNLLAYVDLELNKPKDALKQLQDLPQFGDQGSVEAARSRVATLKRIGDMYLRMRKTSAAIAQYKLALTASQKLSPSDPALIGILEPLVGCLQDTDYKAAQPYAEQLVSVSQTLAKSGDLVAVASLFWSEIELLQIYKHTNNTELHAKLWAQTVPLAQKLINLRMKHASQTPEQEDAAFQQLQNQMLHSYITENRPATLSDYLWTTSAFRMRSLPLIAWQPPDKTAKAAILCVHGLGLENRAFGPLANKMIARDFAVYAMDVRGFGAWQSEYGHETVSFDRTLSDVSGLIKLIKYIQPGLPVFLLGESMGGAIVLRAASEYGDSMDGVIASVPSADRYGSIKMAREVAFHLLRDPNKPFDIGTQVAKQATSQVALRELWKEDPKAKTELSPIELIKFDRFMNVTKKKCSLIRSTPVMVVQGKADKLVKPKGTYEMFDNVNSPDKTMIVIGNADHLIFETPKQSKVLLDGLSAWLDDHLTPHHQAAPEAAPAQPKSP